MKEVRKPIVLRMKPNTYYTWCGGSCNHEVKVKIVSYHKYPQLPKTHEMAHEAMRNLPRL